MFPPVIWISIFWGLGLYIGERLADYFNFYYALFFSLFFFILAYLFFSKTKRYSTYFLYLTFFWLAIGYMQFYLALNHTTIEPELIKEINEGKEVAVEMRGVISEIVEVKDNKFSFVTTLHSYRWQEKIYNGNREKILVTVWLNEEVKREALARSLGSGISFSGVLKEPPKARNPGGFDYKNYLAANDIYWIANVNNLSQLKINYPSFTLISPAYWRYFLSSKIAETYGEPYQAFIIGLLLGDRSLIPDEISTDFRDLGLTHVLAISGLNFTILAGIILTFLRFLKITRERSAIITIIVLFLYAFIVGLSPSVFRAVIMASLLTYAYAYHKRLNAMQALAIAWFLLTIWQPLAITQPGLQLSFAVTFALLIGSSPLALRLKGPKLWRELLAVTLIAQITSFPIIFFHFHEFSFLSFFVNLLIAPVIGGIIMPLALISVSLGQFFLFFLQPLIMFNSGLLYVIFNLTNWLNLYRVSIVGSITFGWVVFYYILILSVFKKRLRVISSIIIFILIFTLLPINNFHKSGKVLFIDVGQGDSAYIRTPFGYNILIDTGGKLAWQENNLPVNHFDVGEKIVLPTLKAEGVYKIDLLVLTHGDYDHIGGAKTIIKEIPVKYAVVPNDFPDNRYEEEVDQLLKERNVKIVKVNNIPNWQIDKVTKLQFYSAKNALKENDESVVVKLQTYNYHFLFAGDIELNAEEQILKEYNNFSEIDVLKVAHHGSNTSTSKEWLEVFSPKWAVISVGRNNRYNHPHPLVLERLTEALAEIHRTDLEGAIWFNISQTKININTMERNYWKNY